MTASGLPLINTCPWGWWLAQNILKKIFLTSNNHCNGVPTSCSASGLALWFFFVPNCNSLVKNGFLNLAKLMAQCSRPIMQSPPCQKMKVPNQFSGCWGAVEKPHFLWGGAICAFLQLSKNWQNSRNKAQAPLFLQKMGSPPVPHPAKLTSPH